MRALRKGVWRKCPYTYIYSFFSVPGMLPLVFPHQLHNQHAQQHRREHHSQQKQPKARLLYFQKKAYQSSQPYQANQAAQLASRKQQISPATLRHRVRPSFAFHPAPLAWRAAPLSMPWRTAGHAFRRGSLPAAQGYCSKFFRTLEADGRDLFFFLAGKGFPCRE